MPVFTAQEMADFRALKTDLAYHDHWQLVRKGNRQPDGSGGWTYTDVVVAAGVGMLRDPGAGNEREAEIAARLGWIKAAVLDVPISDAVGLPLDIRPTDVIVVNGTRLRVGGETTVAGFLTVDRSVLVSEEE
jgi:hypothetical protein